MVCYDGFGNLHDGRPKWTGAFAGDNKRSVLFYHPGDRNWWLGRFDGAGSLQWNFAGNTAGFGQVWDGRPFWTGDFAGDGRTDVLFYFPGDKNWWLGRFDAAGRLNWNLAGNTAGFGQIWDGRPFWTGDFSGDGKTDVLFYFPGDKNWWLGRFDTAGQLSWNLAGNTAGFGQIWDGRPFWTGDFSGDGKTDVLFYHRGDGNWWLGRLPGGQLTWNHAGNTGRPYNSRVRIHLKVLAQPTNFTVPQAVQAMRDVFASVDILAEVGTTENLQIADADIETGDCVRGQTTAEQRQLFDNRNNVGANDVAVYLVRTVTSNGDALNGCAAHDGRPSCLVARGATRWTLAHEVGHVLGLDHVASTDRLMTGGGTANITNPPPDLVETERQVMENSPITQNC